MSDAVSRDAVLDILDEDGWLWWTVERIRAIPAVQPAHVNETPKSEHVPGDVLTPDNADPDDPDDPHILQAIIDSLLTDIADLTRQLQGQPRRPQDVTKGGAQPHVNETPKSEHEARDVLKPATKGGDA